MAKLIVKDVQQKTTKSGNPYLAVKSSTDKFYPIWQEHQYLWHLFVAGSELDVILSTQNGGSPNITGVVGIIEPNKSGGTTLYKTGGIGDTKPNAMEWIVEKIKEMDKKIDWLVDEQRTLNSLRGMESSVFSSPAIKKELNDFSDTIAKDLEERPSLEDIESKKTPF